jgi:lipopolysaccharide transport system permease protein
MQRLFQNVNHRPAAIPFKFFTLLYKYRFRFFAFSRADFAQQYAGSLMGAFWALLFPLIQLLIYAVLYAVIFKVRPPGMSEYIYTVFVLSGLLPVLCFSQSTSASLTSISSKKLFLLNAILPPELIVLSSVLLAQIGPAIGLIVVTTIALCMSLTSIGFIIPLFALWILLLLSLSGLGLFLSLLNIVVKDLQHSISLVLMVFTVLSPFAFTSEMVPSSLRVIILLNPLSYYIRSFQDIIVYNQLPSLYHILPALAITGFLFTAGTLFFSRAKYAFFDYV